jgi:hypothetical protein
MADFPQLKNALLNWVNEAISRLATDSNARYRTTDLSHWQCDPDRIFRDIERDIELWDRQSVNSLVELPSWAAVLDIIHADDRLNRQLQ